MLGLSIFCSERSEAKAEMLTFAEPYYGRTCVGRITLHYMVYPGFPTLAFEGNVASKHNLPWASQEREVDGQAIPHPSGRGNWAI